MAVLYDISHNPLTTDQASGTLVDDGATPSGLLSLALTRQRANLITAMMAAQPTVPVDGFGNIAFTLTDWQAVCKWAARPYDSFDTVDVATAVGKVMADISTTGLPGTPTSQADILLRLIWTQRTYRRSLGLPSPNPVQSPNDPSVIPPWALTGGLTFGFPLGAHDPNGNAATICNEIHTTTSASRQQVDVGQPVAGRSYTFTCWVLAPAGKATIGLYIGSTGGSGDDLSTSITLTPNWQQVSITQTFALSGNAVVIGLENRTSHSGDGIAGNVWMWGAQVNCNS